MLTAEAYLYLLSQSYNATVFYVDISFLAHVLYQLFLPNESSINQTSNRTMVLTKCFQLFKKLVPVFVQHYAPSQYLLTPKYGQRTSMLKA